MTSILLNITICLKLKPHNFPSADRTSNQCVGVPFRHFFHNKHGLLSFRCRSKFPSTSWGAIFSMKINRTAWNGTSFRRKPSVPRPCRHYCCTGTTAPALVLLLLDLCQPGCTNFTVIQTKYVMDIIPSIRMHQTYLITDPNNGN